MRISHFGKDGLRSKRISIALKVFLVKGFLESLYAPSYRHSRRSSFGREIKRERSKARSYKII